MNETFLYENVENEFLSIDGYNNFRFDHTPDSGKTSAGGIIVYTRNNFDFELLEQGNTCSPDIESMWLKLSLKQAKPTFINCFYRPPSG